MLYKANLISFIFDVADKKPRLDDFSKSSSAALMSFKDLISLSLLIAEKYKFSHSEFSKSIRYIIVEIGVLFVGFRLVTEF